MKSQAKTVEAYLKELPPQRASAIAAVRNIILRNLPSGYEEAMGYGMIVYQVPFSIVPDTYNKQPLCYAGLASQKNYMALYVCESDIVKTHFRHLGKVSCGKGCIRFKRLADLNLTVVESILREILELRKQGIGPSCSR